MRDGLCAWRNFHVTPHLGVTRVMIFIASDDDFACGDTHHCIAQCRDQPRGDSGGDIYHSWWWLSSFWLWAWFQPLMIVYHHCTVQRPTWFYTTAPHGTAKRWTHFGQVSPFTGFRWENPIKSLLAAVVWQSLGKLLGFPAKLGELVSLGKGGHMDDDADDSLSQCRCWYVQS